MTVLARRSARPFAMLAALYWTSLAGAQPSCPEGPRDPSDAGLVEVTTERLVR